LGAVLGTAMPPAVGARSDTQRLEGRAAKSAKSSAWLFLGAALVASLFVTSMNLIVGGNERAIKLLGGHVPTTLFTLPDVSVFPARLVPLTNDPLHLCTGGKSGYVLGRQAGTSYLLIGPNTVWGGPGVAPAEVFPVKDTDYAVITGALARPPLC
jgi:hypothetical protein